MNWKIQNLKNPVFWVQVAARRVCDGSGLRRSDRCGYDHLGGRVADHQGHGGKSVLPVPHRLQRVVGAERSDH